MTQDETELRIRIETDQEIDRTELDGLTTSLCDEILYLDVDSVAKVRGDTLPKGAMSLDWVQVGEIAVKLAPFIVPALATVLKAWIERQHLGSADRSLRVRLKSGNLDIVIDSSSTRESMANLESDLSAKKQVKDE